MSLPRKQVVVLISGRGSNLDALIQATAANDFPASVCAVISNRHDASGLAHAQRAGIPTRVIKHTDFSSRAEFDHALRDTIESFAPDLVVLAGFMRVLTPEFVHHFNGRLINIHPSLLPHYKGLHTHQRAIDDKATLHGASVHFVTSEVDDGAVIVQAAIPVHPGETAAALSARVLEQEHIILPMVVRWFAEGRLYLQGHVVFMDGQLLKQPILI